MNAVSWRLFGSVACLAATALVATCTPPTICARGQPVTIPAADTSDPSPVTADFQGRGGTIVRVTAGVTSPPEILMPPPSTVLVNALAQDPEGIKSVWIAVQPRTCTTFRATGQTTCVSAPTQYFKSVDAGAAGAVGCTARAVQASFDVSTTLSTSKDRVEQVADVLVIGQNFGGRSVNTGWKQVRPRP